jgi:hypothetical protein
MTSLVVEQFAALGGARASRSLDRVRRSAEDGLAGKTVWCAAALPSGRESAGALIAHLRPARERGVRARRLEVSAGEPLARVAEVLQAMLSGGSEVGAGGWSRAEPAALLGAAERAAFADGMSDGETLIGRDVASDDVVVLHDALTPAVATAARDRGAHVVWLLEGGRESGVVRTAWTFLRPFTSAVDAFVTSRRAPDGASARISAVLPCNRVVAAKDVAGATEDVGWASALAEVVGADRSDTVGGTLRARPTVAAR